MDEARSRLFSLDSKAQLGDFQAKAEQIQTILVYHGHLNQININGNLESPETREAVVKFQESKNLVQTGKFDDVTIATFKEEKEKIMKGF